MMRIRLPRSWPAWPTEAGLLPLACNTDTLPRAALFYGAAFDPIAQCHDPIIAKRGETRLDAALKRLCATWRKAENSAIPNDLILVGDEERRINAGTDLLARLLRGVDEPGGCWRPISAHPAGHMAHLLTLAIKRGRAERIISAFGTALSRRCR